MTHRWARASKEVTDIQANSTSHKPHQTNTHWWMCEREERERKREIKWKTKWRVYLISIKVIFLLPQYPVLLCLYNQNGQVQCLSVCSAALKMAQDTSSNCNASLMSYLHNPTDKKKKKNSHLLDIALPELKMIVLARSSWRSCVCVSEWICEHTTRHMINYFKLAVTSKHVYTQYEWEKNCLISEEPSNGLFRLNKIASEFISMFCNWKMFLIKW